MKETTKIIPLHEAFDRVDMYSVEDGNGFVFSDNWGERSKRKSKEEVQRDAAERREAIINDYKEIRLGKFIHKVRALAEKYGLAESYVRFIIYSEEKNNNLRRVA